MQLECRFNNYLIKKIVFFPKYSNLGKYHILRVWYVKCTITCSIRILHGCVATILAWNINVCCGRDEKKRIKIKKGLTLQIIDSFFSLQNMYMPLFFIIFLRKKNCNKNENKGCVNGDANKKNWTFGPKVRARNVNL